MVSTAETLQLSSEIDEFITTLSGLSSSPMTVTELERNGQIQREMKESEIRAKKKWGSKKDIFSMGKRIDEMSWLPTPKRIYSANSQIKSWHGYNDIRTDRRIPWVVTAHKTRRLKRINLFELDELLGKNPNRKVERKETYSLSFDIASIEDPDIRTFIDDNTILGGRLPSENYETFILNGSDEHKRIAAEYGVLNTHYEHYIYKTDMYHEYQTYAKSIKYTTKKYRGLKSIYLGTACSIKRSRKTEYVLEIAHCFTEIDHYKIDKYKHLTAKELYPLVLQRLADEGFPKPTDVSFSQGLQLIWKISPIGSYKRNSWIIVQRKIYKILEEFGADSAVITDTVRLLRLAGSIHEKTGKKITAISYTNDRYDFENLLAVTCPEDYAELLKRREIAILRQKEIVDKGLKVAKSGKSIVKYIDASQSDKYKLSAEHRRYNIIHSKRLFDLLRLIQLRNGEMTGMREIACFLTRYWYLCMTGDQEKAITKMKDVFFSLEIYGTYEFDEIIQLTSSAETAWKRWVEDIKRGYNYSQKRLSELLNITPTEAMEMFHIMPPEEALRRRNLRDKERDEERNKDKERNTKKNRRKGHKDLNAGVQKKKDKIKDILRANNYATNSDIEKLTGFSNGTVKAYAKEMRMELGIQTTRGVKKK